MGFASDVIGMNTAAATAAMAATSAVAVATQEKTKHVDSAPSECVLYPGWQLRSKHSWISERKSKDKK